MPIPFCFLAHSGRDKITYFQDDVGDINLADDQRGGGMTSQWKNNTYASVDGGDIVIDLGSDPMRASV